MSIYILQKYIEIYQNKGYKLHSTQTNKNLVTIAQFKLANEKQNRVERFIVNTGDLIIFGAIATAVVLAVKAVF